MKKPSQENLSILLTIDVEDWFQVENLKSCIPYTAWPSCELRVEGNTRRLLDLLDSVELVPRGQGNAADSRTPKATFFVLAWIAERFPRLVKEIRDRGHEIGSHGCAHRLCSAESSRALWDDLTRSKQILEDISGERVSGFRAPSFSISETILECIRDAGYLYDSSYNSFSLHGRYGRLTLRNRTNGHGNLMQPVQGLYELPISNVHLGRATVPWGGGAYFRLIPERLFRSGIHFILKSEKAYVMYLHPWEIDPGQPRVKHLPLNRKLRHYSNLGRTQQRMADLVAAFSHCDFPSCSDYIRARNGRVQ